jgi:hypothetical protein
MAKTIEGLSIETNPREEAPIYVPFGMTAETHEKVVSVLDDFMEHDSGKIEASGRNPFDRAIDHLLASSLTDAEKVYASVQLGRAANNAMPFTDVYEDVAEMANEQGISYSDGARIVLEALPESATLEEVLRTEMNASRKAGSPMDALMAMLMGGDDSEGMPF